MKGRIPVFLAGVLTALLAAAPATTALAASGTVSYNGAAGIGQHDLLDVLLIHSLVPSALCCLMMFGLYALVVYLFKYHFAQLFQSALGIFAYLFAFPENILHICRNIRFNMRFASLPHPALRPGIEWTAGGNSPPGGTARAG